METIAKFEAFNEMAAAELQAKGIQPPEPEDDLAGKILYWVLYVGMWAV